jgi:predicted Rossmann-fold nucleotide-binding protein
VLFGSAYWKGLVDWLRDPVLAEGKISPGDVDMLEVTDDPGRVLEVVRAVEHRRPRVAGADGAAS